MRTHRGGFIPAATQPIPFWEKYEIDPNKTNLRRKEAVVGIWLASQPSEEPLPKPEEQTRSKLQMDCDAILKRDIPK